MLTPEFVAFLEEQLLKPKPMRYNNQLCDARYDHLRMAEYCEEMSKGMLDHTLYQEEAEWRCMFILLVLESEGACL